MKIVRYRSPNGQTALAQLHPDGRHTRLNGDLFAGVQATNEPVQPAKILAPLDPVAVLCTGLNYRKHAVETGSPLPPNPPRFLKTTAALQHPGEPIVLPRWLASARVDWECEL